MSSSRSGIAAFAVFVAIALVVPVNTQAQGYYTFGGLADTRPASRFSDFGLPVINTAGDVTFAARLKTGGSGIYKWAAGSRTLVTIFEDPTEDRFQSVGGFQSPAITDAGVVIFQRDGDTIVAGSGGATTVVADDTKLIPLAAEPARFGCQRPTLRSRSADVNGRVVLSCTANDGAGYSGGGIYLGNGGTLERICDAGNRTNIFDRCFTGDHVEVSPNGVLAGVGYDSSGPSFRDLLLLRGDGAGLDVLLERGVHTSALAFPIRLSRIGINSSGTVTYDAYQDTPGGSGGAVFKIDVAGVPISITDPRNFVYRGANSPSINRLGEIPFADALMNGLFIGPDPASNKVIVQGDVIPGYDVPGIVTSVVAVSFQHPGINPLGELAFVAFLADGTLVITRAIPPTNHPPSVTMGDQSSPEGSPVSVHVTASDQDGDDPLTYEFQPDATPDAGMISGVPPGINTSLDANGDAVGTPDPGTAGNNYAVSVVVTDSRGLSTTVDFVWTITDLLPPPRVNLTATTNPAAEAIDLAWQNPSPDTADQFWIGYSTNGPAGPFQQWGFGPVATTSQRIVDPLGNGVNFCFTVKGVITQGASFLHSLDSNIACVRYPTFTVSPPQPPGVISTPTSVSFTVLTNREADLTLEWPEPPPSGVLWTVTPDAAGTSFAVQISNLPSASTQTSYSVTLRGRTRLVGLLASRTVPFVTTAVPAPPPPGPGRVAGESAHRQGPLELRLAGRATLWNERSTAIVVELINRGTDALENLRPLVGSTYVVSACIQSIETCGSQEFTKVRPLERHRQDPLRTALPPGGSVFLTLVFDYAFATLGGWSGNPTLQLLLTYENASADLPFTLNVAPLPDVPADLVLTLVNPTVGSDGTARVPFGISNLGLAPSGNVTLEISVSATRSAVDSTPVPLTILPLEWKKFVNRQLVEVDSGSCAPTGSALVCRLSFIEPNLSVQSPGSYVLGTLDINAPGAGQLVVSASASSRIAEFDYTRNVRTQTIPLVPPPAELDLSPEVGFFSTGPTSSSMRISASNAGPAAASDVVIEVVLPATLKLAASSSARICTGPRAWGATLICRFPLVGIGGSFDTVQVDIAASGDSRGRATIVQWNGGIDLDMSNNNFPFNLLPRP